MLVIFDSTRVDVQESGLSYVNTHKLYKVFTPEGALQLKQIIYDYDPLSAYVDIEKVIIYRKDGTIEPLDMSKVLDYPAPARAIYWGASEKMIEVGRLEPGDAVEVFLFKKGFTYALLFNDNGDDDRYIPPMRGHFYDIVEFWSNEPVLEKVYMTWIPRDKFVQYEFYNGEVRSSVTPQGDKVLYSFTKKDVGPIKREPWMVASSDVAPKLLISTSPDWYAKAVWFHGVNEDFGSFEYTPEISAKVDEILRGAVDEMDSVSRLTHWCADEIRYSGISMGEGEGYTLHKGEMTFTDRCGVCKDKAGMLVTMLRAAGFESYPAMTMAGSRIDYIPADQFNHSVTVVRLSDGEWHLLDPTWVPFLRELWSSAEQQQNYLMGIPGGADLAITPISPAENHYIKIRGTSSILEDGTLEGEITVEAEGQSDGAIRGIFTRSEKARWQQNLESQIKDTHPLAQITGSNYDDPMDYMAGPIQIRISYRIPDYAIVTEENIIFTPIVASKIFTRGMAHMYQNTGIEKREYAFRDRCSRLVQLQEEITLPENMETTIRYVPEADSFSTDIASFEGKYALNEAGNTLQLDQKISLNKRIYEAEDWPDYRKAVMAQQKFAEEAVILKLKQ
jgi:transglutaminase-like putative cysteine protease